jgi:formate/nitrite transporter FocA (FNT family)
VIQVAAGYRRCARRPEENTIEELSDAFQASVDLGQARLERSTPGLIATGLVGGADVTLGVFALLLVLEKTGNELLGAVAFIIGFIALELANSELFTENFLLPVAAVVAGQARWPALIRLWIGTLTTNLIGGWLVVGMIITGFPELRAPARTVAEHYVTIGIGWRSMAGAILGGAIITLMTWMERSTESPVAKIISASIAAFLLAAGPLNHVIVVSLEMFAALISGAAFGYRDWASIAAWYTLGNMIGGIVLVTGLRLVQVGRRGVEEASEGPGGDRAGFPATTE